MRKYNHYNKIAIAAASLAMSVFCASPSPAQENTVESLTSAKTWNWGIEAYFWGASIGGSTTTGGNIDIGIDTLIDNLKMGGMAAVAGSNGQWGFFGDMIYLDVGDGGSTNASIGGVLTPVNASIDLKAVISTAGVSYRLYDDGGTTLDGTGGVRLLWMDSDIRVNAGGPTITSVNSGTNWDAVVGLRGKSDLNDRWYLTYYADVGTGQSDLTWQAAFAANYRFKKADLTIGYRYMDWNLKNFGQFNDLNLSGTFIGVKFPL